VRNTELFCPGNNLDFNAQWPTGVIAGQYVEGKFCKPGWTGLVGRQCLPNGQWAPTASGSCNRTLAPSAR